MLQRELRAIKYEAELLEFLSQKLKKKKIIKKFAQNLKNYNLVNLDKKLNLFE